VAQAVEHSEVLRRDAVGAQGEQLPESLTVVTVQAMTSR
jgi:hypothetical protein